MLLDRENVEEEGKRKLAELAHERGCRVDEIHANFVVDDPRPAGKIPDELKR